MLVRIEAVLVD